MYRLGVGCQNPLRSLSAANSAHANELGGGGAKEVLRCSRRQRINEHLVEVSQRRHHPPEQSGELMGATAPERGSTQVAR